MVSYTFFLQKPKSPKNKCTILFKIAYLNGKIKIFSYFVIIKKNYSYELETFCYYKWINNLYTVTWNTI